MSFAIQSFFIFKHTHSDASYAVLNLSDVTTELLTQGEWSGVLEDTRSKVNIIKINVLQYITVRVYNKEGGGGGRVSYSSIVPCTG